MEGFHFSDQGPQQGCHDVPSFADKDVVGAACRSGVHGFDANAGRHQRAKQGRRNETQYLAAAKYNEFRSQLGDGGKMGFCQVRQSCHWPSHHWACAWNQDTALVRLAVDGDGICRVGIDDVDAFGAVCNQLHDMKFDASVASI